MSVIEIKIELFESYNEANKVRKFGTVRWRVPSWKKKIYIKSFDRRMHKRIHKYLFCSSIALFVIHSFFVNHRSLLVNKHSKQIHLVSDLLETGKALVRNGLYFWCLFKISFSFRFVEMLSISNETNNILAQQIIIIILNNSNEHK